MHVEAEAPLWSRPTADVLEAFGTTPGGGLSSADAVARVARHGPNVLAEKARMGLASS